MPRTTLHTEARMRRLLTPVALLIGGTIAMTQPQTEARAQAITSGPSATKAKAGGSDDAIRPFRVHFSDAALADMKRRIAATRWPQPEIVADQSQGVQLATVQKLASYWATDYDWRKIE